jgi:hypothetical protein
MHMNNGKKIFGADMSSLKGKSTHCKFTLVREDVIEIPEEQITQNCKIDLYVLTLCMSTSAHL